MCNNFTLLINITSYQKLLDLLHRCSQVEERKDLLPEFKSDTALERGDIHIFRTKDYKMNTVKQ